MSKISSKSIVKFRFNHTFGPHFGVKISTWHPNF